jgi:hypothetical protein
MSESLPVQGPGEAESVSADDLLILRVSARLVAQAFDAWARKDWATCDALVSEGVTMGGEVFAFLAERVTSSPEWRSRVESPAWGPFLDYLAFMALHAEPEPPVPAPRPAPRPAPPPSHAQPPWERKPDLPGLAKPGALSESMRKMGLM